MTGQNLQLFLLAGLAALLCWVVVSDLKTRTIPNWTNGLIALGAPVFWYAQGLALWPDIAAQIALAGGTLAIFSVFFALRAMGGGDVKMLAALALWFPAIPLMRMLVIMSLAGGVLTIIVWLAHKYGSQRGNLKVPYGVAISLASLWTLYERNLNHFG